MNGMSCGTPTLPPTPDKLSLSSTAARRTCSSLSICSFSRSSSSCIIIRPSSGLGPALEDILGTNFHSLEATFWLLQKKQRLEVQHFVILSIQRVYCRWRMNDLRWMSRLIIMERKYHEWWSGRLKCCPLPFTKGTPPFPPQSRLECRRLNLFLPFIPLIHLSSHHSSVIQCFLQFSSWALERTL